MGMKKERYFRGNHNYFYYTSDAWKTYEKTEEMRTGYEQENSANIKKQIDIRETYDANRATVILNELLKIRRLLIKKNIINKEKDDGYGSSFEVLAINVLHNFEYNKIIDDFLVTGDADGKIDAVVFDNNECLVYQIKMKSYDNEAITKGRSNIREFISSETITAPKTGDLLAFCNKHKNYFEVEPKYYEISTDGSGTNHIDSDSIFTRFFENNIVSQDFKANKYVLKIELEKRISTQDGTTEEKNYSWLADKAYFTFVKAKTLIAEIKRVTDGKKSALDKLFGFNVRGFKGENKPMKKTLETEPSNFCLYNNGISIVGRCTAGDFLTINEPYVVNGQQTLLNLLKREDKLTDEVYVPLFIKNYNDNIVLMNIAKFNNKQSSIKAKDLLSIDSGVREIQKKLFEHSDYYLNILSSGKKTYMKMVKKIYDPTKIIELSDFLRCYSVSTTKNNLATWKNNISNLLEKEYIGKNVQFDLNTAKKVCNIIENENSIIASDGKYAIGNVAIEYVLSQTNNDISRTKQIIDDYMKARYDDVPVELRKNNKAEIFRGKNEDLKVDLDKLISGQAL